MAPLIPVNVWKVSVGGRDTSTDHGDPVPPGVMVTYAFRRQVAGDISATDAVGDGNMVMVYASVCVLASGQLLST